MECRTVRGTEFLQKILFYGSHCHTVLTWICVNENYSQESNIRQEVNQNSLWQTTDKNNVVPTRIDCINFLYIFIAILIISHYPISSKYEWRIASDCEIRYNYDLAIDTAYNHVTKLVGLGLFVLYNNWGGSSSSNISTVVSHCIIGIITSSRQIWLTRLIERLDLHFFSFQSQKTGIKPII